MTSAADAATYAGPTSQFVPVDWAPIVPSAEDLPKPFRAIRADTECTIEVRMPLTETTRELKFLAGETRYGMFTRVEAISAGTAEGAI
jgi:hypothetical protein